MFIFKRNIKWQTISNTLSLYTRLLIDLVVETFAGYDIYKYLYGLVILCF